MHWAQRQARFRPCGPRSMPMTGNSSVIPTGGRASSDMMESYHQAEISFLVHEPKTARVR
jgi:hypothetical protein